MMRASGTGPADRAERHAAIFALMEAGRLDDAAGAVRAALNADGEDGRLLNLLGVILRRANRLDEAIATLHRATAASPREAAPWTNLGNCHLDRGEGALAADCFARSALLDPHSPETHRLWGHASMAAARTDDALRAFETAIGLVPTHVETYVDAVRLLRTGQRFGEALVLVDRGLAALPANRVLRRARASLSRSIGRLDEARSTLELLLAEQPDDVESLVLLGNLHAWGRSDHERANTCYRRALDLAPDHIEAIKNYCMSLGHSRHGEEAAHFEQAYALACSLIDRSDGETIANAAAALQGILLRAVDFEHIKALGTTRDLTRRWVEQRQVAPLHGRIGRVASWDDRHALVAAHRAWGRKIEAVATRTPLDRHHLAHRRDAARRAGRIRIGLLSSDLRDHPVMYFLQPLIEHHDRARFEIHCYSAYPGSPDAVQDYVIANVSSFHRVHGQPHRSIAQRIADDGIDVLFDLGGATRFNQVQVCAWRPAPVQVSWLGYPHSVGLESIDYFMLDPHNRPVRDDLLIEQPLELPETFVAMGQLGFPEVPIDPRLPEERAGHLTFGTANNPFKYTPQCIAAWAAVLNAVAGSHFMVVRPEAAAPSFQRNLRTAFGAHGVHADRLLFTAVRGQHLRHYDSIDIALDPFPLVGGTTTCESLWMGVPTVTLRGAAFCERLSASMLCNAGLPELCADDAEAYVQIAIRLAADRDRRRALRYGLRAQIRAQPLGQGERFVRGFERVVQSIVVG